MPTRALPNETAELVDHDVAFQGYFPASAAIPSATASTRAARAPSSAARCSSAARPAAVLPYDPRRDEVVLIRQFRAGAYVAGRHPWTWEIVAGIIEDGEIGRGPGPARGRRGSRPRGRRAASPIHDVMLDARAPARKPAQIFLGRVDTTNAGGVFGLASEGEDILVKVLPFAEAYAMLERNEIDNAIGVIALQWLALHRDEVRKRWR